MNRREELLRLVRTIEGSLTDKGRDEWWTSAMVVTRAADLLSEIDKREPAVTPEQADGPVSAPVEDEAKDWQPLQDRLRTWAVSNVPEGIEIVDGVPMRRAKEPEAFFDEDDGTRWHFVEAPFDWIATSVGKKGTIWAFGANDPGDMDVTVALRAYLDARGIEWRHWATAIEEGRIL